MSHKSNTAVYIEVPDSGAPTVDGLASGYTYAAVSSGGTFVAAGFLDIFGTPWYFAGNPNTPQAIGISQDAATIVAQCTVAASTWSMWFTDLEYPLAAKLEMAAGAPSDSVAQRQVNDLTEHVRILEELLALEKLANENNGG